MATGSSRGLTSSIVSIATDTPLSYEVGGVPGFVGALGGLPRPFRVQRKFELDGLFGVTRECSNR